MSKQRLLKWFGYISTLVIFIVGVVPGSFNIPVMLRPWVFLGSIVWVVVFASGVFQS